MSFGRTWGSKETLKTTDQHAKLGKVLNVFQVFAKTSKKHLVSAILKLFDVSFAKKTQQQLQVLMGTFNNMFTLPVLDLNSSLIICTTKMFSFEAE